MATKSYESRAQISAPPEQVWSALIDVAAWPSWDSGVVSLEGTAELGAKLKLTSSVSPRAFPLKVTELEAGRRLTLVGGMPLGLFKGVRTYTLTATGDGTEFAMREDYSGPLQPLIGRSIPDLQPSFDQFARGLKQRVEG